MKTITINTIQANTQQVKKGFWSVTLPGSTKVVANIVKMTSGQYGVTNDMTAHASFMAALAHVLPIFKAAVAPAPVSARAAAIIRKGVTLALFGAVAVTGVAHAGVVTPSANALQDAKNIAFGNSYISAKNAGLNSPTPVAPVLVQTQPTPVPVAAAPSYKVPNAPQTVQAPVTPQAPVVNVPTVQAQTPVAPVVPQAPVQTQPTPVAQAPAMVTPPVIPSAPQPQPQPQRMAQTPVAPVVPAQPMAQPAPQPQAQAPVAPQTPAQPATPQQVTQTVTVGQKASVLPSAGLPAGTVINGQPVNQVLSSSTVPAQVLQVGSVGNVTPANQTQTQPQQGQPGQNGVNGATGATGAQGAAGVTTVQHVQTVTHVVDTQTRAQVSRNSQRIDQNSKRIDKNASDIAENRKQIKRVGAAGAAASNLHYNRSENGYAVAVGEYAGSTAIAGGLQFNTSANTAVTVQASYDGADMGASVGFHGSW